MSVAIDCALPSLPPPLPPPPLSLSSPSSSSLEESESTTSSLSSSGSIRARAAVAAGARGRHSRQRAARCQAEVGHLGRPVFPDEDVTRLDVTVQNRVRAGVQGMDASGGAAQQRETASTYESGRVRIMAGE